MISLSDLPPHELSKLLASLTDAEKGVLNYRWSAWARPAQLPPKNWTTGWLVIAGRGYGKTRMGAEAVRDEVESGRSTRIALISETSADGRDVMVMGESGILAVSPPWNRPTFVAAAGRPKLTWSNGAVATLYDAREPDQLRGPQHDFLWFDEIAKYRYADEVYEMAMFGLRLGVAPRWIATTTPRPIGLIRRLMAQPNVVVTRGKTTENLRNLAPSYRENVIDRLRGTRIGRQELDAEILEDVPGALWSRRALDEGRVLSAPPLVRIVVGVDPAITSGDKANETGIIVAGIAADNQAYVLEDWSAAGTPDQWARKAVAAYRKHQADFIIAESNQGGEMVRLTLQTVGPNVPIRLVHASRGKFVRAEPISALYEQGRVHHVGTLPALEDQMTAFTPERAADRSDGFSPDRVDSLVWALTHLFPDIAPRVTREMPKLPAFYQPNPSMGMLG